MMLKLNMFTNFKYIYITHITATEDGINSEKLFDYVNKQLFLFIALIKVVIKEHTRNVYIL